MQIKYPLNQINSSLKPSPKIALIVKAFRSGFDAREKLIIREFLEGLILILGAKRENKGVVSSFCTVRQE
jgi:hypothetical protein